MKKISLNQKQWLLFSIILMALIIPLGCNDSELLIIESNFANKPINLNQNLIPLDIGIMHNEAMEFCLYNLTSDIQNGILNRFALLDSNYNYCSEYIISSLGLNQSQVDSILQSLGTNKIELMLYPPSIGFASDFNVANLINTLSNQTMKNLFNDLITLVDTTNPFSEINNGCNFIMITAQTQLNESEAKQIEIACIVAIYSYQYWDNRFNIWEKAFEDIKFIPNLENSHIFGIDPRAKRIIRADVNSAITGVIWGATSGASLLGVGAVAGAIFGACIGATYGSVWEGFWVAIGW